jgi:hypothetical protein
MHFFALSLAYWIFIVPALLLLYFLPFFICRRIGKEKGLSWFWWAFFLHWIGVLVLALRKPRASAATGIGLDSGYHVPPALAAEARRVRLRR